MTRPRRLVSLIVAIQIAIPALLLALRGSDPRPSAFGWQMFTSGGGRYAATVVGQDGSTEAVDVDRLLLRPRVEVRLDDALVRYLCARPDAAAVTVSFDTDSTTAEC